MRPSRLDPERWRRIDAVFDAALEAAPAERAAFLDEACAGDEELRAEVEALLEAHARSEPWLAEPVSPLGAAIVTESAGALAEGRQVGPFRILREIGRGGMGVVFLAEDTRLGRHVALKVLPPYLGTGPEARHRFVSEARTVSTIDHPNVATLHEIDTTADGQLYMVFSYYEGETLAARIARGPLPPEEAVAVAKDIAEGLDAAHRRDVIHRDVKPSNVLLTEGGGVKLLDFGVAKVAGEDFTGAGVQPGTIAFMSPEQASGSDLDARADLWALGVVLYAMLTGVRPFLGSDRPSLIRSILDDEPEPPGSLGVRIPEELERVVAKLLCKDPEGRYQAAADLVHDLSALQDGQAPPVATREPTPSGRSGALASVLRPRLAPWLGRGTRARAARTALVLGAVAGGFWLLSTRGNPPIQRLAVLPLENLTGDPDQTYFVDGIHGGLVAELGKIRSLSVVSRTSVLRFRDPQGSLPSIAEELGVDALVEGSVMRDGDRFSIDVRLVAASPERTLWADRYQAGVGSAFDIAGSVARSVAAAIDIALSPQEERRLTSAGEVDPEVLDLYYRGQANLDLKTAAGFAQAREYLGLAIEMDSSFAPAYGLLGEAYGQAAFFGLMDPTTTVPHVERLTETGLAVDSTAPELHTLRAHVRLFWDRDAKGAEESARRAIELNPSYGPAYWALSEILSVQERYEEALESAERGSDLQRFTPFSMARPVVVLQHMRDFEGALERVAEGGGFELYPDFWQGRWLHCLSLAGAGRYEEAVGLCRRAVEMSGRTPMALGALGYVLARNGQGNAAMRVAEELERRARTDEYVGASHVAMVYAGLGDADRAFEWLRRATNERDITLIHLADQQFWDSISDDPRFADLLRAMGMAVHP